MTKAKRINGNDLENEVVRLQSLLDKEKEKRREIEKELTNTLEHSQSVVEAEKQFLANMSHEIRNPINAIVGLINLLYDTRLTEEQFEYVNNIKYSADILMSLISDILDLSKIEAGKVDLNERIVDISEVIRAIVQTYSFKTHDQDIQFKIDIEHQLKGFYKVDPTVINQIFLNLIGNAVKFTEKGFIEIEGTVIESQENMLRARFRIRDTGIGIPDSQLSRIFEVFRQGSIENKVKYGGTGLGLSIVKKLVSLYNGDITVESKEGKGSAFTITLNLTPAHQEIIKSPDKNLKLDSHLNLRRVLIVEDNKINQQYLTWLFKKWGIAYDVANNGSEALDLTEENTYDLVLMDIRMPVMDGYETTIRLRNRSINSNCNVPIIALTASALVDEKEKALEVGMNMHLPKPFTPDQLRDILNNMEPYEVPEITTGKFHFSDDLNIEYLNSFYGEDVERAKLMFEIFLKNIDRQLKQLEGFYKKKDWEAFVALAHKIKPNFAMVGLPEFGDSMRDMELLAGNQDFSKLSEKIDLFNSSFSDKKIHVNQQLEKINNFLS